jgi:hypothetical protein
MKRYLIRLSSKNEQESGMPWAIKEFDSDKIYVVKNFYTTLPTTGYTEGTRHFIEVTGNLSIINEVGYIN